MGAVPDCEDGQKGMEEASAAGKNIIQHFSADMRSSIRRYKNGCFMYEPLIHTVFVAASSSFPSFFTCLTDEPDNDDDDTHTHSACCAEL